ncbi:MAG: hypothetical protein AB7Y46_05125 [Armatimonadota bacterium]
MRSGLRTSLLITIPFVLLLNADSVTVSVRMWGDLSGIRQVRAVGDSSLARDILRWTRQTTRGYDDAAYHTTVDYVVVARSTQRNDLGAPEDAEARALDIAQQPLSLITTCTWSETVTIDFLGNEKEAAAAPLTTLEYRLTMPGTIRATTPPAQVNGHTAVWRLSAEQAEHVITATSTQVRWDVVVVLAYVAGYLAYRTTAFLARRARLRPRKI